jgi:hypothetical protein
MGQSDQGGQHQGGVTPAWAAHPSGPPPFGVGAGRGRAIDLAAAPVARQTGEGDPTSAY